MPTLGSYILIGVVAAVTTLVVTPFVGMLARRYGWLYLPNDRTVHEEPLPDVGGLAIYAGFLAAFATASQLGAFEVVFDSNSEPWGVLIAATIIFGVGFIDDVREISAPAKVFGTVLAGMALVQFGVVMFAFRLPYLGTTLLSDDLTPLITVLWLLGMTQAVNLIDGLDGLAAGVVAIGAASFFLYSERLTDLDLLDTANIGPLFAVIAAGLCLGFLPHNFNPARIFMGDGGALLLGLLMAVSTSVVGGRADSVEQESIGTTYFFLAPIAIPLLILGVPIFDTLFAVVRRATSGTGLASADKGHLHHRLMKLGHGHRRSVVILWAWTSLLSAFVLYPTLTDQNPTYLPFGIAVIGIVLYTVLHPSVRARRRSDHDTDPATGEPPVASDVSEHVGDSEPDVDPVGDGSSADSDDGSGPASTAVDGVSGGDARAGDEPLQVDAAAKFDQGLPSARRDH